MIGVRTVAIVFWIEGILVGVGFTLYLTDKPQHEYVPIASCGVGGSNFQCEQSSGTLPGFTCWDGKCLWTPPEKWK